MSLWCSSITMKRWENLPTSTSASLILLGLPSPFLEGDILNSSVYFVGSSYYTMTPSGKITSISLVVNRLFGMRLSFLRILISLTIFLALYSSLKASLTIFIATSSDVLLLWALRTKPKLPYPSSSRNLYYFLNGYQSFESDLPAVGSILLYTVLYLYFNSKCYTIQVAWWIK